MNKLASSESDRETGPDRYFREALQTGRFVIQRSRATGEYSLYPRIVAPGTGASDLEWEDASGLGSVYSTTVVLKPDPEASYNISIIEFAEGPRMLSRVIGMPVDKVWIGMAVRAEIGPLEGEPAVLFRAATDGMAL
jgi:uncharacterized OB-fold protein